MLPDFQEQSAYNSAAAIIAYAAFCVVDQTNVEPKKFPSINKQRTISLVKLIFLQVHKAYLSEDGQPRVTKASIYTLNRSVWSR